MTTTEYRTKDVDELLVLAKSVIASQRIRCGDTTVGASCGVVLVDKEAIDELDDWITNQFSQDYD